MSLFPRFRQFLAAAHLNLIALVALIVPRRLRSEWREEWHAELQNRERLLVRWGRLDWNQRRRLLRHSAGAVWDALSLQRHRLEDEIVQDVRWAFRLLARNPSYTGVIVVTLALGIGANTAVFAMLNALLLRPLGGVADPDRLVQIGRQYPDRTYISDSSYPDFLDYQSENRVMAGMAAVSPEAFHVRMGGETDRLDGELVSGDYFEVLGVSAAQGRLLSRHDDTISAGPVVVISHRLWRGRFAQRDDIVGTGIRINGRDFTVIGVAGEHFSGIRIGTPRDIWIPLAWLRHSHPADAQARLQNRRASWLEMFGRLRRGVSLDQARAEFSNIASRLERAYPETNAKAGVTLEPGVGHDAELRRQMQRFAALPFAGVGIVLLIACANVAGLLMARGLGRQREIAARLALGARRVRVIRQLLVENLTLALLGGAAGLVVGGWLTRWLRGLLPDSYLFLSFDVDFAPDWRVFGFTMGVAAATGMLFGILPALRASRSDFVGWIKGAPAFSPRRGSDLRAGLVATEVALSTILLIAAGLCVKTMINAAAIDPGYRADEVLTARIDLPEERYGEAAGHVFQQVLIDHLAEIPGVRAAAFAVTLPLNDSRWENPIRREGDSTRFQTFQNVVSEQYFEAMNIQLLAGRVFSERDREASPHVAILNETLARTVWPGVNPLGRRVTFRGESIEVIGVVGDIKGRNLFGPPDPIFYLPLSQHYQPNAVVHLRTALASTLLPDRLRGVVQALDRDVPVYRIRALEQHVAAALTPQRLLAHVITAFGILALTLAAVGLYALLTYMVSERTREIGVRLALGASARDITLLVVTRGMTLAIAGLAVGVIASAAVTQFMKGVLFGVDPIDPLTMTAVPVLFCVIALAACCVPALRATRADPTVALRWE